ncbi:WW domain-containing adapter protein with coiled-coil [Drosophila novamexicana]|uniref:WW domain-containing adapter protein with coiled-coil n=1 Tax=Drosophila novamexicana TaxID=47314 RepID=UPI0011E5AB8A|nr:WW domain-containing adapter protein with coiled-coil [Drosophila novamexicana]
MAIQLDKILADISKEKALHPNNASATKQEQDDAWARIGRLNKLTVHESRSIFIVLQKKYEQEKLKGNSGWKLFGLMQKIHQEPKTVVKTEDEQLPMEEVEEYEMLEVQEQEEDDDDSSATTTRQQYGQPTNSTGSASSDGDSPTKSNSTGGGTPEKEDKPYAKPIVDTPRPAFEEKKLLNTMANNNPQRSQTNSQANAVSVAAAALQKKGITLKKTPSSAAAGHKSTAAATAQQHQSNSNKATTSVRTTIQLPDSMKRKLSDECASSASQKKLQKTQTSPKGSQAAAAAAAAEPSTPTSAPTNVVHTTTAQLLQVKKERESNQSPPPGINIITIPAASQQLNGNLGGGGGANSSTGATMASTSVASTNGYSPHLEELDFKNEIIFDSSKVNAGSHNTAEIINLGNFDNSLPPTFFKNLCNSTRHEALGLYVANVMNRISQRAAAKLELGILRAIVDVQSDELEQ